MLHAGGLSNLLALACGAGLSALIVVADMAWHRRVNALALIVLLTLVLAVIVSLISGNARVTLARDCVITGGLGLVFLGSLTRRRPLVFHLLAPLVAVREPGGRPAFDHRFDHSPELRSALRVTTAVWGVVLLGDAALRLLAVVLLSVTAAATAATALTITTMVILVGWLRFHLPRRVRTAPAEPTPADLAGA